MFLTALLVAGFKLGLIGGVVSYMGAGGVGIILLSRHLRQKGVLFRPRWNPSVIGPVVSFGLKSHIGNLFQFFNYRLDMFILNYFLGPENVGLYTVSVALAEMLWFLPNAVGFVIFPQTASTRHALMNRFTPKVCGMTLLITALGALVLCLSGKILIPFIYSDAFQPAYSPLLILLPGVVLLGGAKVLTNDIAGRGFPHYNSMIAGVTLILTVLLDILLIPRYGVSGAAFATTLTYAMIAFAGGGVYVYVSAKAARET
jgi:O-antigen/teichoic acid export membrane protein